LGDIRSVIGVQMILNEREAGRARAVLGRLREALSGDSAINAATGGLSLEVIDKHHRALATIEQDLSRSLREYEEARDGKYEDLVKRWHNDLSVILIIARIARGLSQAELAAHLGLREQQIQRYESERYRSITFSNFRRIALILGVDLAPTIRPNSENWFSAIADVGSVFPIEEIRKVEEHARKYHWFEVAGPSRHQHNTLIRYINHGSGVGLNHALFKTGLKNVTASHGLSLLAWKARVAHRLAIEIATTDQRFDPVDISWIQDLTRLSRMNDGISRSKDFLLKKGIVLIVEPQIPGLGVDGAAFLINGTPVIALTLRHDRIDNFWQTLFHELGHIFLHHSRGLFSGFFDDIDHEPGEELETEANEFAAEALIPFERWKLAPARVSKSPVPVENFAQQVGIHSAIVFGRIRKERNNYKLFTDKIGQGEVRKQLLLGE
jgi:HTH-type transcriptional regulator / antitoxin HigA